MKRQADDTNGAMSGTSDKATTRAHGRGKPGTGRGDNGNDSGNGRDTGASAKSDELVLAAQALPKGDVAAVKALLKRIVEARRHVGLGSVALLDATSKKSGFDAKEIGAEIRLLTSKGKYAECDEEPLDPFDYPAPVPVALEERRPFGEVLSMGVGLVQKRVALSRPQAVACVLWGIGTWAFQGHGSDRGPAYYSRLNIRAGSMNSGKTTLLETVAVLCKKPFIVDAGSAAALRDLVHEEQACILADEADGLVKSAPELQTLFNSGVQHGKKMIKQVQLPDGRWKPKTYRTFAPAAICGIGATWRTVESRSVRIHLRRSPPPKGQIPSTGLAAERERIAPQIAAWEDDITAALERDDVSDLLPGLADGRERQIWAPLLAVAALGGPEWLAEARATCLALAGDAKGPSLNETLLMEIAVMIRDQRIAVVREYKRWCELWRREGKRRYPREGRDPRYGVPTLPPDVFDRFGLGREPPGASRPGLSPPVLLATIDIARHLMQPDVLCPWFDHAFERRPPDDQGRSIQIRVARVLAEFRIAQAGLMRFPGASRAWQPVRAYPFAALKRLIRDQGIATPAVEPFFWRVGIGD
ncbi:DUF3631 domain-containing protein [Microvirga sesbaniae]|uniref:DUF3631 domain-containing protein n=1 Tax=Microvirga sesbaniae TaxID=681392 RepID=UPI0021C6929A|nr:DUF3631 domain-containing protein [Microvirga sp. HBU67692]